MLLLEDSKRKNLETLLRKLTSFGFEVRSSPDIRMIEDKTFELKTPGLSSTMFSDNIGEINPQFIQCVDDVFAVTADSNETAIGRVDEGLGVDLASTEILGGQVDRVVVLQGRI